ncbi:Ig-like domain-containing protein, partial [Ligilactobacillus sp. LYQ135]
MLKKNIILTIIVTIIISLIGINMNQLIKAETVSIQGTAVKDAKITNSKGQDVTDQNNLNKWESYTVSYNWSIPNGTNIKSGDVAIFEVPDSIDVLATTEFAVKDSQGNVIGDFIINKGAHQGTLTFNNYYETHKYNNIHGTLTFSGNGNENQQVQNWEVNKNGWLNGNDIPTWVVVYNPNSEDLTNIQIIDTLKGAQKYILNSFQLQLGSVDKNNDFTVEENIADPFQYIKVDGDTFTLSLDNVHQAIRIVYQTQPTFSGSLNLENSVEAKSEQLGISSVAASIHVTGSGNADGDLAQSSSLIESSSSSKLSSSIESSSSSKSSSSIKSSSSSKSSSLIESSSSSKSSSSIKSSSSSKS